MSLLDNPKARAFLAGKKEPEPPEHDPDLVPEFEPDTRPDDEAKRALKAIPIEQAIEIFGLKFGHKVKGGHKIQCPDPGHGGDGDADPSGSSDVNKNTWCCHSCPGRNGMLGGDIFDLGAVVLPDFDYWTYQNSDGEYARLKEALCEKFGITVEPATLSIVRPSLAAVPPPVHAAGAEPAEFPGPEEDDEDDFKFLDFIPPCNWQELVPEDTFVWKFMENFEPEKLPLWYGFWEALALCGLATGREAYLDMGSKPVYPNLFLGFYGSSGYGKTRSLEHLKELIRTALPHTPGDVLSRGVKVLIEPNSDVRLIEMFEVVEKDSKGVVIERYPLRGFLEFDELASLIGKADRQGNPMKPVLHKLYDGAQVDTSSRTYGDVIGIQPFCTTIAGTQPRAARKLLMEDDVDSGFLGRWLPIMAHRIPVKERILFAPYPDITSLAAPLTKIHAWSNVMTRRLNLEPTAQEQFKEFVEDQVWTISTDKHPLFSKIELTVKKLLTILAINKMEDLVSCETVQSMISLFPYNKSCLFALEGNLATNADSEFVKRLEGIILRFEERAKRAPTYNEIWCRVPEKDRKPQLVRTTLDHLVVLGVLMKTERVNKRGPKSTTYTTTT